MHLLPCNAMDTVKIGKRSRLLAFGALLLEFLVDFRTNMTDIAVAGQCPYILKFAFQYLTHLILLNSVIPTVGRKRTWLFASSA